MIGEIACFGIKENLFQTGGNLAVQTFGRSTKIDTTRPTMTCLRFKAYHIVGDMYFEILQVHLRYTLQIVGTILADPFFGKLPEE